jgi:hypothetical protein
MTFYTKQEILPILASWGVREVPKKGQKTVIAFPGQSEWAEVEWTNRKSSDYGTRLYSLEFKSFVGA